MTFQKSFDQENVLPADVYAMQTVPGGAYITIAGRGEDDCWICAFDLTDLRAIAETYLEHPDVAGGKS